MLKRAFKGVKFSVTSDYSSCNVSWTDGPTDDQVSSVIGRFDIGEFDSMTDYAGTKSTAWAEVFGGVQYLWTKRQESPEFIARAIDEFFADREQKPSADDWTKGQGVFDWRDDGSEWTRRQFRKHINQMQG